jgi:short-subunit dehydrogenase
MREKVVIITGASSGIGLACAREFSSRQAKVVMAARDIDKLHEIEKELKEDNPNILSVKTDVTQQDDCKHLIDETFREFGTIDILINNAGISMRASFNSVQLDVLKKLMDVNFWGTVYCTKFALPHLIESGGSLIGISSIAGFKGLPGRTGYSASKFAMHGFLETIRIENLRNGLHVMVVAPGFTSSNIRKAALDANGDNQKESPRDEKKLMAPETVARAIIRGIKFRRRNMILSWEGKILVLFQRVLPKTIDWLAYREMAREPNSPFK